MKHLLLIGTSPRVDELLIGTRNILIELEKEKERVDWLGLVQELNFHFNVKLKTHNLQSTQENKKQDFEKANMDFATCSELGILIDKETRNAFQTDWNIPAVIHHYIQLARH